MPTDPFRNCRDNLQAALGLGDAGEHTHRPALKTLLEVLHPHLSATNEPKQITDVGAPDMIVRVEGATVGFVEAKDIGVSLDAAEKSDQLKRYLTAFPNLLLTDYLEFRWYVDGKRRARARWLARTAPPRSFPGPVGRPGRLPDRPPRRSRG